MEFTETELNLLKWMLGESAGWLSTDEDFTTFDSIADKLGFTKEDIHG